MNTGLGMPSPMQCFPRLDNQHFLASMNTVMFDCEVDSNHVFSLIRYISACMLQQGALSACREDAE